MEEREWIEKWLNGSLEGQALEAFKETDTYKALHRIDRVAQYFKAPDFEVTENYKKLVAMRTKAAQPKLLYPIFKIAAILVLLLSIGGYWLGNRHTETVINATVRTQEQVIMPDDSEAILNAVSVLSFLEDSWEKERKVKLHGEAFFSVAKGKQFDVVTEDGIISVLGTQFNVKNRDQTLAVSCYEGLVAVQYGDQSYQLPSGHAIRIQDGIPTKTRIVADQPDWLKGRSSFRSIPYQEVLKELERQYGVMVQYDPSIANIKFSGTFTHRDLDTAMQSLTLPLRLQFVIKNKMIIISK